MISKISITFLFLLFFFGVELSAQKIDISVHNQPLNKVFIQLRDNNNFEFSYDDNLLSNYNVTLKGSFKSGDDVIKALLQNLPLKYEKSGEVYMILSNKVVVTPKYFTISGQVIEAGTKEPLPYSHVLINTYPIATDFRGTFSYTASTDSVFYVKASHLGCHILDTMLTAGSNKKLFLTPAFLDIPEVVVTNSEIEKSLQIGNESGHLKLNKKIAGLLPGNGDNSVFNLLRLQPGIAASGEQSNELLIWGSSEGQSTILFDGFTLFGRKEFNDNISAVNPYMVNNIEVYKGGFDARFGERIGGIVNIIGKTGNSLKPSFHINLNSTTFNTMVEVPLLKGRNSLMIAFRKTYYNLIDPQKLNVYGDRNQNPKIKSNALGNALVDYVIAPDYSFGDMNIKYTAKSTKGNLFYISLLGSSDLFTYNIDLDVKEQNFKRDVNQKSKQRGLSTFYGKTWLNGSNTSIISSYSGLISSIQNNSSLTRVKRNNLLFNESWLQNNSVIELSTIVNHRFSSKKNQTIETGFGVYSNKVNYSIDSLDRLVLDSKIEGSRINMYVNDNINFGKRVTVKIGLRATYPTAIRKLYLEPRLSASIKVADSWKINAAWGLYNQYLSRTSLIDSIGNISYFWVLSNGQKAPVLRASHTVLGLSYFENNFTLSVEGYFKQVTGVTRYIQNSRIFRRTLHYGDSRSMGVDFYVKKDFSKHSLWGSYSLCKAEEKFNLITENEYRRAPQDQRHEVKFAGMLNFDPIFITANYVWGSGFPLFENSLGYVTNADPDYNRCDVSLIYRFARKSFLGELGVAVLNVFNSENIKYGNYEKVINPIASSLNFNTEAIPFTPAIYLKIDF